ncbi:MFS transporter [Saccharopolyspora sp. WRP15-2]|uniref:MFS transporter n=1 Tax=Saccharopolyspora oryzae TaxID=2997343 RepID=A0ABT4UVF1_9PSEU|nr:MFS transporter [Saccharopolyspora oryzae]MDA3625680.1 MFS transporter [Saccharopolyspora oryzae]
MKEKAERRTSDQQNMKIVILSSILGTTIEWYDFFLYGMAASLVFGQLYFPGHDPAVGTLLAFATFAVGFVARPVGGLIFGHIGDRIGRKKTLVTTMMIMGVATFLIGLVPTYDDIGILAPILLVLCRVAQGVAIGGEWGGAVLLAVEYAGPRRKGLYGSWPQVGLALGLLLGTGAFLLLSAAMDEAAFLAYGWRIAFLFSVVLVLIGMFVRLKVMETPAFTAMRSNQEAATVPAAELLRDRFSRRHLLLGMGSRLAEGVAFNTWGVFILSYGVKSLGLHYSDLLRVVLVCSAVMVVFIPLFGHCSDRWGSRKTFALGAMIFTVLAYPVFGLFETRSLVVLTAALLIIFGVAYPLMYGPQAALYCDLFPTKVRYTGISLVYQLSGIFASGLTPLILASLLAIGGTPWLMVAYLVLAGGISTACTLAMRPMDSSADETRGAPRRSTPSLAAE